MAGDSEVTRGQVNAAKAALGADGLTRSIHIYPRMVVFERAMTRDGRALFHNGELLTESETVPIRETDTEE